MNRRELRVSTRGQGEPTFVCLHGLADTLEIWGGIEGLRRAIFGKSSPRSITGDAIGLAHVTRCLKSLHDDPLTPKLGAIRCPVLVLVGDKDPMGAGASVLIRRALADADLEVIPGRGHWLHVDCPDVVLAAIDRYLIPRLTR